MSQNNSLQPNEEKSQFITNKSASMFKIIGLICIIFIFSTAAFVLYGASSVSKNNTPYSSKKVLAENTSQIPTITLTTTPTSSPSPSPIPTPTVAYSGFCVNIPVIFYHHIEPLSQAKAEGHGSLTVDSTIFDQQMQYLSTHYHAISADELINSLVSHQVFPSKSILITLDDGYADNYNFAFPIIKKYNLVANLFLATGLVGNPGYMSWSNIKEMSDSGLVRVYNHTWSHYSLPRGDLTKIDYEISTAQSQILQNVEKSDNGIFAYPYGTSDSKTITELKKYGYHAAFTTLPGTVQCDSFILGLHRTRIGNSPLFSYGL